jgi:hypothetical protein
LGIQPLGHRGTQHGLDLAHNAAHLRKALEQAFPPEAGLARRAAFGMAYYGLGLAAYNTQDAGLSRRYLAEAVRFRPGLWRDRRLTLTLAKAMLGQTALDALRRRRSEA